MNDWHAGTDQKAEEVIREAVGREISLAFVAAANYVE